MDDTRNNKPTRRSIAFQLAAVALVIVSALAGTGLARWLRKPPAGDKPAGTVIKFPNRLFRDWKKPDFVLVLTGQMYGYVLPCGCSRPQVGGLERRYNFLQQIKEHGWPYVAVDLGDLMQQRGPAYLPNQQALIKYTLSMKALKAMDYSAIGIGEAETTQDLLTVLAEYALQDQKPRVVISNLMNTEEYFPDPMTAPWHLVTPQGTGVNVGITSVVGPSVGARIKQLNRGNNKVRFERTPDAINRVIRDMAAKKVHLPVMLYQGPMSRQGMNKPWTEAMACAEAYPQFPVIVCLSEEDDPPAKPVEVTTTAGTKSLVITLGKKGKYVGVVGVYKTGQSNRPFTFRYERAEMTEDFMTPEGKEADHPILALMESYTRELKSQNYLEKKYGQVRHQLQVLPEVQGLRKNVPVTYVGSDKCKTCHRKAYRVWEKTPHHHAYQTLVDATRPSNRQYDPECVVCHTVGFGYLSGFVSEARTPMLKDVGCESCHGPSSVHVANPNDVEWQRRVNPWKYLPADKRKEAIDMTCQKCHDIDNDVTYIHGGFEKKWPKVKHYEGPDPMLERQKEKK